jgi:hypothetical protein
MPPDLEFLPAWYPQLQRKKRLGVLQAYMTVALTAGLIVGLLFARHNASVEAVTVQQLRQQVTQKSTELRELDEQVRLKDQLTAQQRVLDCLGVPVDVARLLRTIEKSTTAETAITSFELNTEEQPVIVSSLDVAHQAQHGSQRRLRAIVDGVAPSNGDIVRLLAGLTDVPFFEDVALAHSVEKTIDGHVVRQFEISFWMNLNQPLDVSDVVRPGR